MVPNQFKQLVSIRGSVAVTRKGVVRLADIPVRGELRVLDGGPHGVAEETRAIEHAGLQLAAGAAQVLRG
jgi:hypothetical protein